MTVGRNAVRLATFAAALLFTTALVARPVLADPIPKGWEAMNMKPVGYSDLGGRRGGFKLAIKRASDGHWYMYMGHLWHYGWSIVDVTDPANPRYVKFIPGPENTWDIQMTLHDNLMITALQQEPPDWGGDLSKPFGDGVIIWDISDPTNPKQLSQWKTGSTGTHRNSYPGGKYAYLSAAAPGYKGNILVILDVSDPRNPKVAGTWARPNQKEEPNGPATPAPFGFHGPANISPDGKIATMGYAPGIINLDISDIAHPKLIGDLTMTPPFISAGSQSEHTVLPLWDRQMLFASSEAAPENCTDAALNYAVLIDNKNMAKPRLMSMFPLPVPPKGLPYKDFCDKGGRFGPHNTNQEIHLPDVEKPGNLIYLTYFNAGLQVYDIKDPYMPKIAGYFIPPQPTVRAGLHPKTKLVNQTEDVLVDTRGYVYVDDKQWGMFILRYTGADQPKPTAK
jgi:hypothetical protein